MINIKKLFPLILFVSLSFIQCNKPAKIIPIEETQDTLLIEQKAFTIISEKGINILNDSLYQEVFIPFDEPVKYCQLNKNLFLYGKYYYEFNTASFVLNKIGVIPDAEHIVFIPEGRIILLKNSVIMNSRYNQYTLLSNEMSLVNIWINPFHKYVYALDSLGYLYSVDYERRILRKKIFTGAIKKINFFRYGSRMYLNLDNSFLICDFETLNIIYKKNTSVINFTEIPLKNLAIIQSLSNAIEGISSIDYKTVFQLSFSDTINDIKSNGDSLFLLLSNKGEVSLFSGNKKIKQLETVSPVSSILLFDDNHLIYQNEHIYAYDMLTDTTVLLSKKANALYAFAFEAPDSIPKNIKTQDKINYIEEIEKEIKKRTYYSVQLHSFTNITSAKNSMKKDKDAIMKQSVFIKKAIVKKKDYYRVYAGKFNSREEADALRELLLKMGYTNDIFVTAIYYENIIK